MFQIIRYAQLENGTLNDKSQKELSQLEVSFLAIKHELNICTVRDMDKRYQVKGKLTVVPDP